MALWVSTFAQKYAIERYSNIRSATSPTLSAGERRLAFLTNITGTSQIWAIKGHGISKLKNRLELYPLVADFLDKHTK